MIDPTGEESSLARQEDIDVKELQKEEITRDEFEVRSNERTEAAEVTAEVASTFVPGLAVVKVAKKLKSADIKETVENVSAAVEFGAQVVTMIVGLASAPADLEKGKSISSGKGARARTELKVETKKTKLSLTFKRKKS
jgi:ribosomal protein S13